MVVSSSPPSVMVLWTRGLDTLSGVEAWLGVRFSSQMSGCVTVVAASSFGRLDI